MNCHFMAAVSKSCCFERARAWMRIPFALGRIFKLVESERRRSMTGKELLIAWLNDAHGMENALIEVLEHQIKDAKDYPQVQVKLEQHLEQTRRHARLVKDCVENLGGSTSALKTGMAKFFGQMQAVSTGPAGDDATAYHSIGWLIGLYGACSVDCSPGLTVVDSAMLI